MPGPHPQRLWSPHLKHCSHSYSPNPPPHQDTFSSLTNLDPIGQTSQKFSVFPWSLYSLFFSVTVTCEAQPGKHCFLSVQITEIWETTISYRLSAGLSLLFHSSFIQFWLLSTKFIQSESQPVATKLSPIDYLSTRVHQLRRHSPWTQIHLPIGFPVRQWPKTGGQKKGRNQAISLPLL